MNNKSNVIKLQHTSEGGGVHLDVCKYSSFWYIHFAMLDFSPPHQSLHNIPLFLITVLVAITAEHIILELQQQQHNYVEAISRHKRRIKYWWVRQKAMVSKALSSICKKMCEAGGKETPTNNTTVQLDDFKILCQHILCQHIFLVKNNSLCSISMG